MVANSKEVPDRFRKRRLPRRFQMSLPGMMPKKLRARRLGKGNIRQEDKGIGCGSQSVR